MKARRIRVYPSGEQQRILKEWFGVARLTYNSCLAAINAGMPREIEALRSYFLNNRPDPLPLWVTAVPYDVRDEAMKDLLKAYESNFAAGKPHFKIRFRSKKDDDASIAILAKHWNRERGVYERVLSFGTSEAIPTKLDHDARLLRTRLNQYFLCIPVGLDIRSESQAPPAESHGTIALDPGVRTFMTGYDPEGKMVEWGAKDMNRIYRLCDATDWLQSLASQPDIGHRKRYRIRRAAQRVRFKIRRLVDDLHHRCAIWLCKNYRAVILPKFETSRMVIKGGRKIGSKTARAMLTWSHYRFRQHLLHKAREFPWCTVYLCSEEYTSKTCGGCGHLHSKLGGAKIFHCPSCDLKIDRDYNAARNILIKFLTERAFMALPLGAVHP